MKLQRLTLLIIGGSMVLFVGFLILFIRPMMLEDALQMDEDNIDEDLLRVLSYLSMGQDQLHSLNLEWAQSDYAFDFANGDNPDFVGSTIKEETFANNEIDRIVVMDRSGDIILDEISDNRDRKIPLNNEILALDEEKEAFLVHENSAFSFVSVRDIYPTSGVGISPGKLFMFRDISYEYIVKVSNELDARLMMSIYSGTDDPIEREFALLNEKQLRVSTYLNDELNERQLALTLVKDRGFYIQKKEIITKLTYYLIGALACFTALLYIIFNRLIVSRIGTILTQLKEIQQTKDVSSRVSFGVHNQDEIHSLGHSINQMLESIEDSQHEMVNMAYHDELTTLLNRYGIYEAFRKKIQHETKQIAFLFFDLDGFKRVNDSLGHQIGDELLKRVAKRLKKMTNEGNELVARMGGDEFIALIPFTSLDELRLRTQGILGKLKKDYTLLDVKTFMTTSVGISIYPADGSTFDEVLQHADIAMYEAKRKGKNQFVFYNDLAGDLEYKSILILENDLKFALKHNELFLNYQPIFSSSGSQLLAVEGLLRWNHRTKGLIPPNVFIPIAENGGFICDIGEWVLSEGIKQVVEWRDAGLGAIGIAVNVSKMQMKQKDRFLLVLDGLLEKYDFDPALLQIEITESDIFYFDKEIREFAHELQKKGVRVALDDFGVGTSSLFNLKHLPVDVVKIDRSFVRNVPQEKFDSRLLKGIYHVLDELGFEVVTEGVETKEQMSFITGNSLSKVQGYYFSRPLPADELALLLQQQLMRLEAASDKRD